jgi:chromosome segregation ATPase
MAEKIVIGEIQIDMEKALREAIEYKKQIGSLKAAMSEAKATTGETSVEYVKLSAEYKAATAQLRSHENMLQKVIQADNDTIGSIDQMRAKLAVISKQWSALSEEERKNSEVGKKLAKEKLDLTNAIKAEEMATGDARRNVGNYAESLSQLPGPLGNAASGVNTLGKSFKALLKNPIVLVIGLIVGALAGLFKAFKSTDEGATKLQARMEQIKAIFDVVRTRAVALIGGFKELFSGNFREAGEKFKETVSGIGDQLKEATKAAYDYQMSLDAIEDSENNYISRSAEIRNAIAKLEFTSQDRTKSASARKAALEEAMRLGEEEAAHNAKIAQEKLNNEMMYLAQKNGLRKEDILQFIKMTDEEQAKASESLKTLRNNNEAKFKDIEQLYANWLNADTAFYEENKRNNSRYTGFIKELQDDLAEEKIEQQRKEAEAAVQVMRTELDEFLKMAEERKGVTETLNNDIASLNETFRANEAEAVKMDWENQQAILEQSLFGQLDAEAQALEQKKQQELRAAEKIGASRVLIEKKYAAAEKKIEQAKRDAKLSLAQQAAENLAIIFGETTAAGKAAAIAATTIDTFRSATAAYSGMVSAIPGPVGIAAGIVAAAASVAMGIANVKKILAVKTDGSGGGSADAGSSGPSAATAVMGASQGMQSTQTSIGNGIVSRDTVTGGNEVPQTNTVLVIDDVQAKQKDATVKEKVSTL